jgi:antitoxin VapB
MAINIKDDETDRLARELADHTGENLTDAIRTAVRERLLRERQPHTEPDRIAQMLLEIGRACAALPVLDARPAGEILGYDEAGLPR